MGFTVDTFTVLGLCVQVENELSGEMQNVFCHKTLSFGSALECLLVGPMNTKALKHITCLIHYKVTGF